MSFKNHYASSAATAHQEAAAAERTQHTENMAANEKAQEKKARSFEGVEAVNRMHYSLINSVITEKSTGDSIGWVNERYDGKMLAGGPLVNDEVIAFFKSHKQKSQWDEVKGEKVFRGYTFDYKFTGAIQAGSKAHAGTDLGHRLAALQKAVKSYNAAYYDRLLKYNEPLITHVSGKKIVTEIPSVNDFPDMKVKSNHDKTFWARWKDKLHNVEVTAAEKGINLDQLFAEKYGKNMPEIQSYPGALSKILQEELNKVR